MEFYQILEGILDRSHKPADLQKQFNTGNERRENERAETEKNVSEKQEMMNWIRKNGFHVLIKDYDPETHEFTFTNEKAEYAFWKVVNFLRNVGKEFQFSANAGRYFPDNVHKGEGKNSFWLFWD